ncbi:3-dehydroquinate synthase [Leptotrichia sp. oral taxon 223]|uniref:3-dehydroquinate synthase n=1 Tax=Leptotrichia sp. oral taxon 223 TaxID=712363 RepID=UPI0015BF9D2E|nr:3-dehydroquinate synthase [Leptotrichia sp. oral taxon 223]NWO19501.1 3-dehydroquinate synthase [Leptotrichia sp. oral taxon 223]
MEILNVGLGGNSYDIVIGENFFERFPEYIRKVYGGKKLFVITDSNVDRIYNNEYEKMFKGFNYTIYVLKAGEKNKHIGIMPAIYSAMVNAGLTRKDMVVAFGGGVVGDIAGFAAASYMRGIDFIQIPTTIVSQVDSSVGGKVGVDLPEGKNLIGAFHQPKLVLIDNYFLNTLTNRYFYDGFAEIVKYGCIYDKNFFEKLENIVKSAGFSKTDENYKQKLREHLMKYVNELVYRSCEIKKEVVEKDEKENNLRMILNFGHTIGHAIEQFTNYEKYSHGEAISAGMVDITKIGERKGITKKNEFVRIEKLLKALNLPVEIKYPEDKISEIMKRDKKSTSDGINFVFLVEIGKVEIVKMAESEVFEQ